MVKALLREIFVHLDSLLLNKESHIIYLQNTGLTEEDQVAVMEFLGEGTVKIDFSETDQPVSWYETRYHGVWVGAYRNQLSEVAVYTVEIGYYPQVAGAYKEDIQDSLSELKTAMEELP